MKKIVAILLVAIMVLAMGAAVAEAKDVKDLKLGFILGSREHAFYLKIEEGINAAASELGFTAVVDESDLQGAIATERIENMVTDGMDAISLACNEPAACTTAIEAADAAGVPMFTFDCTSSETDVIKCFVGTDNYQGGVVGGEACIAVLDELGLKEGATVGIIGYPEPQSCIDRENGWMEVMNAKKDEYKLNIVNIGNYKGDASKAQELMEAALTANPEMAVKAAGASTKMIGFDANPGAHEAILDPEDGKIWVGDVAQDPFQIGHKIAEEMVKYMTEGTVDDQTILIAPYLVDASNAVKPE